MLNIIKTIIIITIISLPGFAYGHQISTAYLSTHVNNAGKMTGELQLRLYDLNKVLLLDLDDNGQLTWHELTQKKYLIEKYIHNNLSFSRKNIPCNLRTNNNWKIDPRHNESYLLITFSGQCVFTGKLDITYKAFFEQDNQHKIIANISYKNNTQTGILSNENRKISFELEKNTSLTTVKTFAKQGIKHILAGYDHILFLLCILLFFTFQSENSFNNRTNFVNIGKIVTIFAIAHSITLTITAMGWIATSGKWIEIGIALTIILSALNNIWPILKRISGVTFIFGLLHGIGFAGELQKIGFSTDYQLLSIAAFNIGIEIGQLLILTFLLPALLLAKHCINFIKPNSHRVCLIGSSSCIAIIGFFWVSERL